MSGQGISIKDSTKGINRRGNFFDTSRKHGGGKGMRTFGTGFSTSNDGNVTIDPSIRAIQDKGLGRIDQLYGETGKYGDELIGNTRTLRERFIGNQSAYSDSQLNPLRQQVSERRGELERNQGLRGISGSSFGEQSVNAYDIESQKALRDASADVEMQQLQALTGIDSQMTQQMFGKISLQAQLNGESLSVAKERLQQELAALGIGADQIKLIAGVFESQQGRSEKERNDIATNISSYFGKSGGSSGGSG